MSPNNSSSNSMKLYADLMSQPCRAVSIFYRLHEIPVQEVPLMIHKGQHLQQDYLARNPLAKIPLLEIDIPGTEQPFRLPESAAMLAYLADTYQVADHWFPRSDRLERAKVEAALHWYHGGIRAGCMRLVFNKALAARLGVKPNEAVAEEGLVLGKRALSELSNVWLAGGSQPFVCGSQICVADLLIACEIEQLTLLNKEAHGIDMDMLLASHPAIRNWMAAVARHTEPHYSKVHELLWRSAAKGKGCLSPAQAPSSRL